MDYVNFFFTSFYNQTPARACIEPLFLFDAVPYLNEAVTDESRIKLIKDIPLSHTFNL